MHKGPPVLIRAYFALKLDMVSGDNRALFIKKCTLPKCNNLLSINLVLLAFLFEFLFTLVMSSRTFAPLCIFLMFAFDK